MSSFQLIALDVERFEPLFSLSDASLAQRNARRVIATANFGFPCRVSLLDAEIGEELLLLAFEHQEANSPYRSTGPIYVRRSATRARPEPGVIPAYVQRRLISVRAYDADDLMSEAVVCAGANTASVIERMFTNDAIAYIHLHNANRGCFSCRVERSIPT